MSYAQGSLPCAVLLRDRLLLSASGSVGRIIHPAAEIDPAGETLNVIQGWPYRSVKIIELYVGGDEPIAVVKADCGADEGAINIDNMRLQHRGSSFEDQD